jgi:beta-glucuronidase
LHRALRTLPLVFALSLALPAHALAASGNAAVAPTAKVLYHDGYTGRYLLDGAWYLRLDPLDQGLPQGFQRQAGLAGWTQITVPNAWNATDLSDASQRGGVAWYRKDFRVPAATKTTSWVARFESVNYRARVYLNGQQIGTHEGAYLPFEVPLTNVRKRGVNHLVIRVDSRRSDSDLPPLVDSDNGTPGGGWWNYGGLLREVYLRKVDRVDIASLVARPILPCRACDASVLVQATLHNVDRKKRKVAFHASVGGLAAHFKSVTIPAHGQRQVSAKVTISNPRLWEPGDPQLYRVKASASIGGHTGASYDVHIGIRSIKVKKGRLILNGVPTTLRGASVHEEAPGTGGALTPEQVRAQFGELQQLGATLTRSHYPLNPQFLEAADRAGVMVWDEIPMYRMSDQALNMKSVRDKGLTDIQAMILRDQNHPSVLTWSIGNENPSQPGFGQTRYIEAAHALVNQMDPTRLLAFDIAGYPSTPKIPQYKYITALGINDYFGWYPGPSGQLVDRNGLGPYLDQMHAFYPRLALFVTEYGAESNRHGAVDEKGTYEFQDDWLAFQNSVFDSKSYLNGAIVWILRDFKVRPGWDGGNPVSGAPYNQKGVMDQNGDPKPAYPLLQRIYQNVQRAGAARLKAVDAGLQAASR